MKKILRKASFIRDRDSKQTLDLECSILLLESSLSEDDPLLLVLLLNPFSDLWLLLTYDWVAPFLSILSLTSWLLFTRLSSFSLSVTLLLLAFFVFFNRTVLPGEGDFLLRFLLLDTFVTVLTGGEGDLEFVLDLTDLPVMTRSLLLTLLMPLYPKTGVLRATVAPPVLGAW